MMNPSSNVCKKCLIVGHLPTGAHPYYLVFQVNNINSYHSILFHFGHVHMGKIQGIFEQG